ncbi:MAG: hypothetical protein HEQ12_08250 [Aphanizomenon flos-aquae DEX188]|jgi:hypothetical protein|nr:MAG: hypothetical protein HEQ12_08250 [Aphanizomenon flos-aquae DEX188]
MQITTAKLRVLTEQLISHSKNWYPSQPLPRGTRGGYKDRFGNEWVSGPSRTKGEPFEWDVQLGAKATPGMRNLSIDGRHVNVSLKGRVTH